MEQDTPQATQNDELARIQKQLGDIGNLVADIARRVEKLEGAATVDADALSFIADKYFSSDIAAYRRSKLEASE